jgi:hypothetical protein
MQSERPPWRVDRLSVVMAAITVLLVAGACYLRFGRAAGAEPPAIGEAMPPLRLLDLQTSESLLLLGQKGKIVWIVFWSADSVSGPAGVAALEKVWKRFKPQRRFSLVTAAVDAEHPERVRAALAAIHASLPVYLAAPETRRRFAAGSADPPLHVLVSPEGHIAAMARGGGPETVQRLAAQVQGWLDDLDPLGNTWFATIGPGDLRVPISEVSVDR